MFLLFQVVIKYVPYVGDSKRAMDEYTSEIMMGGTNTIALHNTCEVDTTTPCHNRAVSYVRLQPGNCCLNTTFRANLSLIAVEKEEEAQEY